MAQYFKGRGPVGGEVHRGGWGGVGPPPPTPSGAELLKGAGTGGGGGDSIDAPSASFGDSSKHNICTVYILLPNSLQGGP